MAPKPSPRNQMPEPDVLDLRGQDATWGILHILKHLRGAKPGRRLEVLATDATLPLLLPLVLADRGDHLERQSDRGEFFHLLIRRRKTPENPMNPSPTKRSDDMSQILSEIPEASGSVDARGSACPGPLLEAKKGIGTVKVGEVLEVLSNDPGTKDDIPIWAKKVGHEYLGHAEADGYERVFVRRKK